MSKRRERDATQSTPPDEPAFEAALAQLEDLVERLEGADLPLAEALATFEAGVALTRRCSEQLESAERRIEVLVREGSRLVGRPFDEAPGEDA
jgi:exodeoxyribonuclease VII small subunit